MTRRWLVLISLLGHLTLAFGVFVAGVWNIEQLPAGRHAAVGLAVMSPPAPAGGGGELAARKVDIVKKPTHDLTQPEPKPELRVEALAQTTATTSTDGTPGEGSGSGSGSGEGTDPHGTGECTIPPCGEVPAPPHIDPPKPPAPAKAPTIVPPAVIEALRISGETQILPPGGVASEMVHDNHMRSTGAFRVCLTTTGAVSSVVMVVSTKYPAYDEVLAAGLRAWRYRPFLVDNRPTAVCGNVTFIYAMH